MDADLERWLPQEAKLIEVEGYEPLEADAYLPYKIMFYPLLIFVVVLALTVTAFLQLSASEQPSPALVFIIPAILLFNYFLLAGCLAKTLIGYILFPYAQDSIKNSHHHQMNAKMCAEVSSVL